MVKLENKIGFFFSYSYQWVGKRNKIIIKNEVVKLGNDQNSYELFLELSL